MLGSPSKGQPLSDFMLSYRRPLASPVAETRPAAPRSSDAAKRLVLAVRVSALHGHDPIEEIRQVISLRGECWFGKLGTPVSASTFHRLHNLINEGKHPALISLIGNKSSRQSESGIGWFEAIQVTARRPNLGTYPEYYMEFIQFIRTWFLLRPMRAQAPNLKNVVTMSSNRPVTESLAYSMSGHFFCELANLP
jgi:hypothetical protein